MGCPTLSVQFSYNGWLHCMATVAGPWWPPARGTMANGGHLGAWAWMCISNPHHAGLGWFGARHFTP